MHVVHRHNTGKIPIQVKTRFKKVLKSLIYIKKMLSFHVGYTHAMVPVRRSVNNLWESVRLFYCVDSRNDTQVVRLGGKLSAIFLPPCFIVHIGFWPHLCLWWPLERVACIWPEMWEQYSWVLWALILVEEVEVNRQFWFTQSWMMSGSQVKCLTMSGFWETGKSFLLGVGGGPQGPSLNAML